MVLRMDAIRIGCRVRKYCYFKEYPDEFTIRSSRPNGNKTELAKILEGWGQYLFYGFANEANAALCAWRLIDLNFFRLWFSRSLTCLEKGCAPGIEKTNLDSSSMFRAFRVPDMPSTIVFKKSQAMSERFYPASDFDNAKYV